MTIEEMKQIKEERGYSLKKLSEYSGVPVVTLQKVFAGTTANPRKATLDAIEKVLLADEKIYQGKAYQYNQDVIQNVMLVRETSDYSFEAEGPYTIKDYNALPDECRVELIDGYFFEMNAPRTVHQDIAFIIHMQFYNYICKNKKPCKVFESPIDVQICCDEKNMLQPDVIVVCDRDKIKGFGIYGAPDFILEILSKSTRNKDLTIKLKKYFESGVREYWIIDPIKKVLITYDLEDENYIPMVHPLEGKVPVAISGGELEIELEAVAESIRELGNLE